MVSTILLPNHSKSKYHNVRYSDLSRIICSVSGPPMHKLWKPFRTFWNLDFGFRFQAGFELGSLGLQVVVLPIETTLLLFKKKTLLNTKWNSTHLNIFYYFKILDCTRQLKTRQRCAIFGRRNQIFSQQFGNMQQQIVRKFKQFGNVALQQSLPKFIWQCGSHA